jgi:hypothetical protein
MKVKEGRRNKVPFAGKQFYGGKRLRSVDAAVTTIITNQSMALVRCSRETCGR